MTLLERLVALFRPAAKPQTSSVGLTEPAFRANQMTVDKLHTILRSAEAGSVEDLFALYRDILGGHTHLQAEFNTRKLAVLGDPLTFAPRDKTNPADVLAAKACEMLKECPTWDLGRNHLLNAALYPVALVEKLWKPAGPNAFGLRYELAELRPVPYHHLDFTDRGVLRLRNYDCETGFWTGGYLANDPGIYITHRGHLLTTLPDYWGGPMRACLFWWLFSVMDRDWWVRFLSRFGSPFLVGKYNTADKKAKGTLAAAFAGASQLLGLVVSKETDVEVKEVSASQHGDAFEKMHEIANAELSKLILGQTMTSTASAGGIGGTQAQVQNQVRGDIRQFDSQTLNSSLETQVARQFLRHNGLTGSVKILSGAASPEEAKAAGEAVKIATASGMELTDAGIEQFSELQGLPFRRSAAPPMPRETLAALSRLHRPLFAEALAARSLPPLPPGMSMPTDAELDAIALAGSSDLADAFTGLYEPLRRLILTSESPEALSDSISKWYSTLSAGQVADLTEQALTAYLANGTATARRPPSKA